MKLYPVVVTISRHDVGGDPGLWHSLGVVIQTVDEWVDTAVHHGCHVQDVLDYRWNVSCGCFINSVPRIERIYSTYKSLRILPGGHDSVRGPEKYKESAVDDRHFQSFHHSLVGKIVRRLNISPDQNCPITSQNKVDPGIADNQSYRGAKKYLEIESRMVNISPLLGSEVTKHGHCLIANSVLDNS